MRLSPSSKGFTLIEVLLAISITALIAILAYTGLSAAINAMDRNEAQSDQLQELLLAMSVIDRDMRNLINRSVRDEFDEQRPVLSGGEFNEYLLEFTRAGMVNPLGLRRSEQQRVHYRIEDQRLLRDSWYVLERQADSEPQTVTLFEDIEAFRVRFLLLSATAGSLLGGDWIEQWPAPGGANDSLPAAIEITLDLTKTGEIRRIYHVLSP